MNAYNRPTIEAAEESLRLAMLSSDVSTLEQLISPDLIFTTHFGSVVSKDDDLEMYRSGALRFDAIELSEQKVLHLEPLAYVSVRARLSGTFGGTSFQNDIRFSRVWQPTADNTWQIIAGQATAIST